MSNENALSKSYGGHDGFFKHCLQDLTVARDCFELYLPENIKAVCDFNTIKVEPGTLVDSNLKQTHTDILYSLSIQGAQGYIYVLIEHQSKPDKAMPSRLLGYQTAIARHHFKDHSKFPVIVPILFYCGKSAYPYSCDLRDYLENPTISQNVIEPNYRLVDLAAVPYKSLLGHKSMALFEMTLKMVQARDEAEVLRFLDELVNAQWIIPSASYLEAIANYLLDYREKPDLFDSLTKHLPSPYKENMISAAQKLERKGRQEGLILGRREGELKGRQEGRQEGLNEGELKAKQETARKMLAKNLPVADVVELTGLSLAQVKAL